MIFACAVAAASHDALKQPASRSLQPFTGAEFSVIFVIRQAGNETFAPGREELGHERSNFAFGNKSATEVGWDASIDPHIRANGTPGDRLLLWLSETQRGMRIAYEFKTCQLRRAWIDIFCEREYLKGASKHLGMQECLERAFGFGRIKDGRLTPIAGAQVGLSAPTEFRDDAG
jgi:hypothetical protein